MNTATIESAITEETSLKEYFAYWKELTANNAKLPASTFLLHDLILGRDPKKSSFTPITNKNKLANGQTRWQGLAKATIELSNRMSYGNQESQSAYIRRQAKDDQLLAMMAYSHSSATNAESIKAKINEINFVD